MENGMKIRIELEALICEREGMIALNKERESQDYSLAYGEDAFLVLAEQIRNLKTWEKETAPA